MPPGANKHLAEGVNINRQGHFLLALSEEVRGGVSAKGMDTCCLFDRFVESFQKGHTFFKAPEEFYLLSIPQQIMK